MLLLLLNFGRIALLEHGKVADQIPVVEISSRLSAASHAEIQLHSKPRSSSIRTLCYLDCGCCTCVYGETEKKKKKNFNLKFCSFF